MKLFSPLVNTILAKNPQPGEAEELWRAGEAFC
jgi:hypothetical protein